MEQWKNIDGFNGLYQVSNFGRVKSLGNDQNRKEKILKPKKDGGGYLQVNLCKEGKVKSFLVHRLVASAFLENPNNLPQVNHKDENPQNNCVENLEWCDCQYNSNYGTRTERQAKKLSKTVLQFALDGTFIKEWQSTRECGRNGFSRGNIADCCRGERKTHKGFLWRYT